VSHALVATSVIIGLTAPAKSGRWPSQSVDLSQQERRAPLVRRRSISLESCHVARLSSSLPGATRTPVLDVIRVGTVVDVPLLAAFARVVDFSRCGDEQRGDLPWSRRFSRV